MSEAAATPKLNIVDLTGDDSSTRNFDAFFYAEYRSLLRLAWTITGDAHAAQDVVQDTMLTLHRNWQRVSGYDRPGAYARRVLLHNLTSRWRRRNREQRALARVHAEPPTPKETTVPDPAFWSVVTSLPARQQQAVLLRYVDDLEISSIADVLGVAEGTVKAHLHRARAALADLLADHEDLA